MIERRCVPAHVYPPSVSCNPRGFREYMDGCASGLHIYFHFQAEHDTLDVENEDIQEEQEL